MNKANLKSYAPKARLDFIKAVTERANVLGISAAGVVPAEVRGDVALIDGREWPAKVAGQRDELIARIKRHGFEQAMDEVAYTWFNRFAALRYMEIHDYLGHGWRVLSSRDGGLPEILRHASEVTLPGLSPDRAREMQLAGNRDNELYKLLLVAQCNELSRVMPFLFERIDDETELLLPENLLRTDSIVAKLVEQVPEEDWQEIEVIGWLYQFYISEKKDQVIGKVVKSEDIPAATQLFTPNWIVQYLVQNSVGRLWLMANPTSTLASQWPYYIQPAEQTPEVQAELDALIQTRIRTDGEALNPETITVLDPACGSGHILVVAYDVLKAIYLERGYQPRAIPRLILERNLYGLDIDDRAAQLAAFALLMKARSDDRRLFNDPPKLNVLSLQDSKGLNVEEIATHLAPFGLQRAPLKALLSAFEHGKVFGSLIQIPATLANQLATMTTGVHHALQKGDLYAQQAARDVLPLIWQALILGQRFDAVVANPPYMGGGFMTASLKSFVESQYPLEKGDLFSCFIRRGEASSARTGLIAFVTMQSWMFLSNYESFRRDFLSANAISSLLHLGNGVMGIAFGTCATTFYRSPIKRFAARYKRIESSEVSDDGSADIVSAAGFVRDLNHFTHAPGLALAYSLNHAQMELFRTRRPISERVEAREGLTTADNARFLRFWWEVSAAQINRGARTEADAKRSEARWYPYQKGGEAVKWFGNNEWVVDWKNDGEAIKSNIDVKTLRVRSHNYNGTYSFREGITWSSFSNGGLAFRHVPAGSLFDSTGSMAFAADNVFGYLALLNTDAAFRFLKAYSPSARIKIESLLALPNILQEQDSGDLARLAQACVTSAMEISRYDETSPTFAVSCSTDLRTLESPSDQIGAHQALIQRNEARIEQMLSERFGFAESGAPEPGPMASSFGGRELLSYAIGCVMGRYSLNEPGLIYADSGNVGFDPSRYEERFPADADGIVPLTDEQWFVDDAAVRSRDFLGVVWGASALDRNLTWLAKGLGAKATEAPDETVRRYLADKFYKDHLQTYRKRPIYWLFSSGKQGAFQALVYLHRYNEGTLARMRAEYVVPLVAKMVSRLDMLDKDLAAASSAAARTKLQKQIEALRKKHLELLAYDEKLRHYADMRIALDLDDGVKVNYAKFGDLVAESKAITGGSDE
ncbi:BREX-1 system adenine-specific DNA-methyltransferase PglX [Rubrivivax sp. JA1055]|uniref:BREX-1 system adenine-specific DNA-methyltransferase PglX n=1 Tax=Rubrivivax sp. JA1055 TaxID=2894194 RepID=UPI001E5F8262|nr:BREX-1 system adenine-specific DNA-methyltransferase PglX [Rubrivivax sp. JA1055]MCC9598317.1 BREX-1 system adenine-specific DNA-methyltransferase PglX [Rubrivivax sp. JA1055]